MLEVMQLSVSQGGVASSIIVVIKFFYIFSLIENGNYYKLWKKYFCIQGENKLKSNL